jgi:hypothetical protein
LDCRAELPKALAIEEEGFRELVWWIELEELVDYATEESFYGLESLFCFRCCCILGGILAFSRIFLSGSVSHS